MKLTSARARTIAISVVAGAILAATPSAAQAARPDRTTDDPTPQSFSLGTPDDGFYPCGFTIDVRVVSRETYTVFSSGALLITGTYKLTVTNPSNGKSLDINASGPGRISPNGNLGGRGPQAFFLGTDEAFGGGIYVFHGSTSFTVGLVDPGDPVDPDDDIYGVTSITWVGTRSENLCAEIA